MAVVTHDPIPAALVEPTPVPEWLPDDVEARNEDLLSYALDLREALSRCNMDKAALKATRKEEMAR